MMRSALAFSGGRDSLAMLLGLQSLWDCIDVVFVDAGDAYPATYALIELVQTMVPHFKRLKTDSVAWRVEHGEPTDANWARCCNANFWAPLHAYVLKTGYRQVLRGDRADEGHLQLVMPGDVINGVLYSFPLWNWSQHEVDDYLSDSKLLPSPYMRGADSMPDCKTCTAKAACGGRTKHIWDSLGERHVMDSRTASALRSRGS